MKFEGINDNDIVISGIGCSLPGIANLEDLTRVLFEGEDVIKPDPDIPAGYYGEYPTHHGHINDPWKFDCVFFGVSKAVARSMDPMVRKILERTYEAILDAGMNPAHLKGTNSAFYSGTTFSDHDLEWDKHFRGGYGIMGRNRCMNANRVSYWLDCTGTSVATDCNWANGITNLENAYNAIKNGHCDVAVVNGASITFHYELNLQIRDMGVITMGGETKTFDDAADGYVRSDGVIVLILQRASVAKRCYGSIQHIFSQSFGSPYGIYSVSSQEQWKGFLETFYKDSGIDPSQICYYEANGTGVKQEDAKELNAVAEVMCKNRTTPLLVGSVKSNLGHTEAASALASMAKAVVLLERSEAPKALNFSTPSKLIPGLHDGTFMVPLENTPLPDDGLIAVSAYGYGGVYAHAVLKPCPMRKRREFDSIPRLIFMADRMADTIEALLEKIEEMPYNEEYYGLLHDIHSKKVGKYLGRGYTIVPKKEDVVLRETAAYNDEKRPVWFIFSGMGSQWNGMGKVLMSLPIFRASIERSAEVLKKKNVDLMHIITTDDPTVFDNILHAFVGIAATQIALVDILNALEIVPDGIIGHSVGELGCAYADGGLTAEQMILCSYYRGLASIETELIPGYMAAVGKGYNQMKDELPPEVDVACHNSGDSCTLSGPADIVKEVVSKLKAENVFAKTVNVANIAYHSRYIAPVAPKLLSYLQQVITEPKLRSEKWISTSNLEEEWETDVAKYCSAEYHTKNLLNSVLFEEGSKHIPNNAVCIEIAPHGLLQAILKRSLDPTCLNIPLTRKTAEDPLIFLLQSIGKMYLAGMHPQIAKLYPAVDYPVPRGTPSIAPLVHWNFEHEFSPNFRTIKKTEHSIREVLQKTDLDSIGCVIGGKSIYPVSVYIRLAWEKAAMYGMKKPEEYKACIRNFRLDKPFHVLTSDLSAVTLMINSGTNYLEISRGEIISHMNIHNEPENLVVLEPKDQPILQSLTRGDIYLELEHRGYDYSRPFQPLENVIITESVWKGYVASSADWAQKIEAFIQLVTLQQGEKNQDLLFPISMGRITIDAEEHLMAIENQEYIELVYSIPDDTVKCPGIEIVGMRLRKLEQPKSTLSFETNHVVPYKVDSLTADRFVEHCIRIVDSNLTSRRKAENNGINILRVVGSDSSDLGVKLAEAKLDVDVNVITTTFEADTPVDVADSVDLVVADFLPLKKIQLLSGKSSFILVRSAQASSQIPEGFEIVTQMCLKNVEDLILLSKAKVIEEEDEFFAISDNELVLINMINNADSAKQKTFYLTGYEEPQGGVQSYIAHVEEATSAPIKWLFILDKKAPSFCIENVAYREQLRKGLTNNVFINGTWGFFEKKSFIENVVNKEVSALQHSNSSGDIAFDYIAINLQTAKPSTEIMTEYSGRLRTGTRVMGILSVNNNTMTHDPHLVWQVPSSWSQQDAATVPLPYLLAYYTIIHEGKVLSYENVLVTDGLTPLGRAAIAVALTKAANVYVTVSNDEEKSIVLKFFPQVKENHIFLHQRNDFDLTVGYVLGEEKPHIVINSLEGEKFKATLRCLSSCARHFHFGTESVEENRKIGMYVFLRYNTLHQMSYKKMLQLRVEDKEALLGLMYAGIRSGVVKPFEHVDFSMEQVSAFNSWSETEKKLKKVLFNPNVVKKESTELQIRSGYSYVIIGDATDVWLDLAESLTKRGANNILIIKSTEQKSERVGRRVQFLQQRIRNLVIHDEATTNAQTVLKEVQRLGPLAAVFLISLEKQDNGFNARATEIDKLWRDKSGHFLVISNGQGELAKLCEARQEAGYPTTNLLWGADDKLIGAHLDTITQLAGKEAVISVTDSIRKHNLVRNGGRVLLETLPKTLEDFSLLGESLTPEVELVELSSMGLRVSEARNLSPYIVIPGLHSDPIRIVQPLARRLKYPVLCVKFPQSGEQSIQTMASAVLEKIVSHEILVRKKTYNVVGVSFGCAVALQLTKLLEDLGHKVSLTIIDSPIYPMQQGKITSKTIESVLLSVIASKSKKMKELPLQSWKEGLKYTVSTLEMEPKDQENILLGTLFVNNQLRALLNFDVTQLRLKGPLAVLHSEQLKEDFCYINICNHVVVREYPLTHADLMEADALPHVLHQCAICDDMSLGRVSECSWTELENFLTLDEIASKKIASRDQFLYMSTPINLTEDEASAIIL